MPDEVYLSPVDLAVGLIQAAESDEAARAIEAELLVETNKQPEDPGVDDADG